MRVYRETENIPRNLLWYLGGIIDGEGYIGILKLDTSCIKYAAVPYYYNSVVKVVSVDKELTLLLGKYFGGYLNIRNFDKERKNGKNYRSAWCWEIKNNPQVSYFLSKIHKTLILKREQAEITLKFLDWKMNKIKRFKGQGCKPYKKKEIEVCEKYYQQMRIINHRGYRPIETK